MVCARGSTLREEGNAEETFARRQIREIQGINFPESPLLSFFARINFRDFATIEKLNSVFLAEEKYQRGKRERTKINFTKSTYSES